MDNYGGVLTVSLENLEDLLCIPEGNNIVNVVFDPQGMIDRTVKFVISGKDMPFKSEGE